MVQKYQVLARKYRPQAFKEVVGQQSAVTTLKNAIRLGKVAHAYLFCGSRGVGKTTLARLFAKALNCQSPTSDLEPCNQCSSCIEISSGQSLDVIEIDGASNRGIDDIRQINETVGYAPSQGKYKIYIIDEVHMLTKEAFNALLKTLEEPPEQAKFFFATTEAHKVLPTIISRCQRFDLARIDPSLIVSKLTSIGVDLSREIEPEALRLIASFSEGSLRDAESLFDQILCFSEGPITTSIVRNCLGLVPQELFCHLDEAFINSKLSYAFELVEELCQKGKDLAHFLEQLTEHYRNLLSAKFKDPSSTKYTQHQLLYILDLVLQTEASFQKSGHPRISLESLLLQILRSKNRIPTEVLVRSLLEGKVEIPPQQLTEPPSSPPKEVPPQKKPTEPSNSFLQAAPPILQPAEPPLLEQVPFNPFSAPKQEPPKPEIKPEPPAPLAASPLSQKHPSHYDTLIRFAAVELEATIKK